MGHEPHVGNGLIQKISRTQSTYLASRDASHYQGLNAAVMCWVTWNPTWGSGMSTLWQSQVHFKRKTKKKKTSLFAILLIQKSSYDCQWQQQLSVTVMNKTQKYGQYCIPTYKLLMQSLCIKCTGTAKKVNLDDCNKSQNGWLQKKSIWTDLKVQKLGRWEWPGCQLVALKPDFMQC
jgi:hypothetical protein